MIAPSHIRGPMNSQTPQHLRADRYKWVEARVMAGVPKVQIAKALGINWRTVHRLLERDQPCPANRWRVVVRKATGERIQIIAKAEDQTAAVSRCLRAYPGAVAIDVQQAETVA